MVFAPVLDPCDVGRGFISDVEVHVNMMFNDIIKGGFNGRSTWKG